jgi:GntR family transcriptional regulator, transcriptional repressor for pyruvate dehydrogenase complex
MADIQYGRVLLEKHHSREDASVHPLQGKIMTKSTITNSIKQIKKPERLSDEVLEQLKLLLVQGDLKPGDQLPTERELSELFGVGRPSIREAIRTLCIFGFLEIRRGSGVYVKNTHLNSYIKGIQESLELMVSMNRETVFEIFKVRSVIEPYAASEAAKNADKDDLAMLEAAFQNLEENISDSKSYLAKDDFEFHNAIALCTHNSLLYHLINLMYSLIKRMDNEMHKFCDFPKLFHPDHKIIFEAIKNRSEKEAARAMKKHILRGENIVRDFYKLEEP